VLAKVQVFCDINAVQLSKLFLKFQGQTVQEECLIMTVKVINIIQSTETVYPRINCNILADFKLLGQFLCTFQYHDSLNLWNRFLQ